MKITGLEKINGLSVEKDHDGEKVVKYNGVKCPLISRRDVTCEQDTSYRGDLLDGWRTYQTPIGVVESHYWASGAGLERSGIDWRIVPVSEITEAQKAFEKASAELAVARGRLEMLIPRAPI